MYLTVFPPAERCPMGKLLLLARRKNVHFQAIYDQNEFIGMVFTVEGDTAVYLGYLATSPAKHGQGYGSQILQILKQRFNGKQIILDIEPVTKSASNYSQRASRLRFYQRNGFEATQKNLVDQGGCYTILATGKEFKADVLHELLPYMGFGFYKFKIE